MNSLFWVNFWVLNGKPPIECRILRMRERVCWMKLSLCFVARLPFDWRNPCGYFIAVAIQYAMLWYSLLIGVCVVIWCVESYIYVNAMSKCIKSSLLAISQSMDDGGQIREQFIEFIEFDLRVKQLSALKMFKYEFEFIAIFSSDASTTSRRFSKTFLPSCLFWVWSPYAVKCYWFKRNWFGISFFNHIPILFLLNCKLNGFAPHAVTPP